MYQSTHPLLNLTLLLFAAILLTSCGTVKRGSGPGAGPASGAEPRTESPEDSRIIGTGMASWYGPNFHGKLTANGETFNMNDLTAAHKTLPFNTVVKVENLDNNRSVIVRINDRGPYVGDRIIDLSKKSAEEVDMIGAGTANVRIVYLREGDRPISQNNISSRETFTVQIASFESESEANRHSAEINGSRVERITVSGKTIYRVYYGNYDDVNDARSAMRQLSQSGFSGFVKQVEN